MAQDLDVYRELDRALAWALGGTCSARRQPFFTARFEDVAGVLSARGKELDTHLVRETLSQIEQALDQSDLSPVFEQCLKRVGGTTAR